LAGARILLFLPWPSENRLALGSGTDGPRGCFQLFRIVFRGIRLLFFVAEGGEITQGTRENFSSRVRYRRLRENRDESSTHPKPTPIASSRRSRNRGNFRARCSSCHGFDGQAKTTESRGLYPSHRTCPQRKRKSFPTGKIHYIISYGVRLRRNAGLEHPHETSDADA